YDRPGGGVKDCVWNRIFEWLTEVICTERRGVRSCCGGCVNERFGYLIKRQCVVVNDDMSKRENLRLEFGGDFRSRSSVWSKRFHRIVRETRIQKRADALEEVVRNSAYDHLCCPGRRVVLVDAKAPAPRVREIVIEVAVSASPFDKIEDSVRYRA